MYVAHSASGETLSKRFLQKYLYYAKHRPWQPVLTPAAEGYIAEQYSQWRVDKVCSFSSVFPRLHDFLIDLTPTSSSKHRLEIRATVVRCQSPPEHLRR